MILQFCVMWHFMFLLSLTQFVSNGHAELNYIQASFMERTNEITKKQCWQYKIKIWLFIDYFFCFWSWICKNQIIYYGSYFDDLLFSFSLKWFLCVFRICFYKSFGPHRSFKLLLLLLGIYIGLSINIYFNFAVHGQCTELFLQNIWNVKLWTSAFFNLFCMGFKLFFIVNVYVLIISFG